MSYRTRWEHTENRLKQEKQKIEGKKASILKNKNKREYFPNIKDGVITS